MKRTITSMKVMIWWLNNIKDRKKICIFFKDNIEFFEVNDKKIILKAIKTFIGE